MSWPRGPLASAATLSAAAFSLTTIAETLTSSGLLYSVECSS